MAIKGGASYQEVAQQLGHTTVAMVIRRYGRYKSAPGRIAAAMNSHAAPNANELRPAEANGHREGDR